MAYGLVLGAMNLIFYQALARIPLGLAVTLEFLGPLALAVAGSHRALDFVWVALAAAGIMLIAPWSASEIDPSGAVLAVARRRLLGCVHRARRPGVARVARRSGSSVGSHSRRRSPFCHSAWRSGKLVHLTPSLLAAGAALALLSSALPFTLEMHALGAMPARTFSILDEPRAGGRRDLRAPLSPRAPHRHAMAAVALVIAASAGATATARTRVASTPEIASRQQSQSPVIPL